MTTTTPARPERRWMFGPAPDLLFGCGVAWMAVFAFRAVQGDALASVVPGALLIMLFAVPHYGATLALVYDSAEARRKYSLFSIYISIGLALLMAFAVRNAWVGSVVLTIYLTWSPWHYTGQNYGIFLTLLGRRAERPNAVLKRFVYGSFVCSFLLTFLSMHGAARATYAPVSYAGSVYRLMPIAIPETFSTVLIAAAGAGYGICLVASVVGMLRRYSLRAVVPCLVLMVTQALWFSVPVVIRQWSLHVGSVTAPEVYSAYGFIWIAAAHSVQYLWFCTYYATGSAAPKKSAAYLGKAILGGYAIWILPGVLFAPALLGQFPAESGLTLMVAALVNLHHFILDGAIWKLRDNRIARILLGGERSSESRAPMAAGFLRKRGFLAAIGVLGVAAFAVVGLNHYETEYGYRQALARGDVERARSAAARLAWIGNDSPSRRNQLGRRYAREGDLGQALLQLKQSIDLQPSADAWRSVAQLHEQNQHWVPARGAYATALALDSRHVDSLIGSGSLLLRLGEVDRALVLLEQAAKIAPRNVRVREPLERARRAALPAGD